MACTSCKSTNNKCGCKDTPLTTAPTYTCPPNITCPDLTPCYETIQDTCVKHSSHYSIYQFGKLLAGGTLFPSLPAGASLENAYQAMSVQALDTNCLPPINVHPSYVGNTTIIINWENTGADMYTLAYTTVPSGAWQYVYNLTETTYTLTLLTSGTNYYFKVITNCNATETNSTSAIIEVTTL